MTSSSSSRRSIFLKSISCKGIKSPIPLTAPSIYATVSLSTTSQRQRTPVDAAHGEDHEWDCPMRFDLPPAAAADDCQVNDLFLEFDLKAQVPVLGDRLVGTAHVPVSDLMDNGLSGHVSYQVLWPDGKPNGTIQLWYRMEGLELPPGYSYSSPEPSASPSAELYYKPSVELGPVYPASVPVGTVPFDSQLVSSAPVVYPPMPGASAYNSEPVESGWVYGKQTGTEYLPYPPPQTSESLYPPLAPNSGFASLVPSYLPARTQNAPMGPDACTTTCYPPPGTHYPPVDCSECGPTYYPPPGMRYPPPTMGSDCCDREYREAQQPVMAYPVGTSTGSGFYPPPPRYPYY